MCLEVGSLKKVLSTQSPGSINEKSHPGTDSKRELRKSKEELEQLAFIKKLNAPMENSSRPGTSNILTYLNKKSYSMAASKLAQIFQIEPPHDEHENPEKGQHHRNIKTASHLARRRSLASPNGKNLSGVSQRSLLSTPKNHVQEESPMPQSHTQSVFARNTEKKENVETNKKPAEDALSQVEALHNSNIAQYKNSLHERGKFLEKKSKLKEKLIRVSQDFITKYDPPKDQEELQTLEGQAYVKAKVQIYLNKIVNCLFSFLLNAVL